MNRWTLLLCGLASLLPAAAFSAFAQTATQPPRVVMILGGTEASSGPFAESFLEGMRQAGQVPGRTVQIDFRYAEFSGVRALIQQTVTESPAAIVVGGLTAARYARDATATVPIVVGTSSDLVDAGLVQSLAHPGGNITGISDLTDEITVKRLQLVKAALPKASRVVLLVNPEFPATAKIEATVQAAAPSLGLSVTSLPARDRASLEKALDSLEMPRPDALIATEALSVQLTCRADQARNRVPRAGCSFLARYRGAGRVAELSGRRSRQLPPRCRLRRQDPQRHETGRSSYLSVSALRARRQCESGAYARTDPAAKFPRSRGSGDSVMEGHRLFHNIPAKQVLINLICWPSDQVNAAVPLRVELGNSYGARSTKPSYAVRQVVISASSSASDMALISSCNVDTATLTRTSLRSGA